MLRVIYMGITEWMIINSLRHLGLHNRQCQDRGVKSDRNLVQKMTLCHYVILLVPVIVMLSLAQCS
jgi:hypothetical protein